MLEIKNLHPTPTCEVICDGLKFYLSTSQVIKWRVDGVPARQAFPQLSQREIEVLESEVLLNP